MSGESPPPSSRRTAASLVGVVAVVLLLVVAALWVGPAGSAVAGSCGRTWRTDPPTATPIQHLFVIVKENHAFENYFGARPGVLGYPPNGSFPTSLNGSGSIAPFPIAGYSTPDLPHDAYSDQIDYHHGANDRFVATAAAFGYPAPDDAVGYYTARQLSSYYAYANYYALGDHFFTGVMGPTQPNRVFDISSYVGSWNADSPPPSSVTDHPTILGELTRYAIPWNYDTLGIPGPTAPTYFPALTGDPCSAPRIAPASDLPTQLDGGLAPSVVYLDPSNSPVYSEHPPENVSVGEAWTVAVVNAIFSSPVANSSAVLIFYDENGGFWDPVPPPMTSTGRDGFRVPFLVLSPWTPPGTLCPTTLDPAAVLRFIDTNWGLPYLTPRVAHAGNLSCFFDFSQRPRPPLLLPTNVPVAGGPAAATPADVPSSASTGGTATHRWLAAVARPVRGESFWPCSASSVGQEVEGS